MGMGGEGMIVGLGSKRGTIFYTALRWPQILAIETGANDQSFPCLNPTVQVLLRIRCIINRITTTFVPLELHKIDSQPRAPFQISSHHQPRLSAPYPAPPAFPSCLPNPLLSPQNPTPSHPPHTPPSSHRTHYTPVSKNLHTPSPHFKKSTRAG